MKYMEYDYPFKIRFRDTDSYGVVHHSNYYCYFEEARYHFSTMVLGFNTKEVDGSLYKFPVLESYCKYIHPLKYDLRTFIVHVKFRIFNNVKIEFLYVIGDEHGAEYATGRTTHAFVKQDGSLCLDIKGWFGNQLSMEFEDE